jgi:2-polyprenyl-6-methoxyphenol hydroxylase-like FAD-dependent oxidoreductase
MTTASPGSPVLIAGAGPTGLVLALWLTHLGVRVRIVDKSAAPGTTSRALAVQSRTLELYRQVGLAGAVVDAGRRFSSVNLWVAGKKAAHVVFGEMGQGLSPYPFAIIYPQDEHERLLIDRLAAQGIQVERGTELIRYEQAPDGILADLKRADGSEETCHADYLAGCDGAHSTIRESLGIGFPGGAYEHLFYVADVQARGAAIDGELHVALDTADFLAVFPLKKEGHARLIGTVHEEAEHRPEALSWNDVSKRVIQWLRVDVAQVNWFSTYRVHHRVAGHFRQGRAFLLGDAAHIHSPVGGQGMNTGIGDAINLAWKLAGVIHGDAPAALLDSYESERIAFARRLVDSTDQAFKAVTSRGATARFVRLKLVPLVLPSLFELAAFRRAMFRTVSQTGIHYRKSTLSAGKAGKVHGGDRLHWVAPDVAGSEDNFTPLSSMRWQLHIYGDAAAEMIQACDERGLPLHVFPWRAEMNQAGLKRNAAYLVRPDGYIALADPEASVASLSAYLGARGLKPSSNRTVTTEAVRSFANIGEMAKP